MRKPTRKPSREQNYKEEADYIANRYWTLYIALVTVGFTPDQAFEFTLAYINR